MIYYMFDCVHHSSPSIFFWARAPRYNTSGLVHIFESPEDALTYARMFAKNLNQSLSITQIDLAVVPEQSYRDQIPKRFGIPSCTSPKYRLVDKDVVKNRKPVEIRHEAHEALTG